jgi:hypothetical protein
VIFRGLAGAVVERIAPFLPEGAELEEEPPGFLRVRLDESRWEVIPLDEPEILEEIDPASYDPPYPAFAVLEVLDFLQEYLRHELTPEWEQGEPWAEQDDEEICFGYAGGTTFEQIPLSTLGA